MSFKFEKMIIWQKAMDLGEDIYEISEEPFQKARDV